MTALRRVLLCGATLALAANCLAEGHEDVMADAARAAPAFITDNATFKSADGEVLKEGSNGYTCYPETPGMGAMCNPADWDALIQAFMAREDFSASQIAVSYMLAGEGNAAGVSNSDPYHPDPVHAEDHVKEGPHLMILVPDNATLEGLSTDPNDPVYVMWAGTPYAHIMVKVGE